MRINKVVTYRHSINTKLPLLEAAIDILSTQKEAQ